MMYLGFIDILVVPHNLVPFQESPVPLLKFQMVLRLEILKFSGSKKELKYIFLFSQKVPTSKSSLVSPAWPLWRWIRAHRYIFTYLLIYLFTSKALSKGYPSLFTKSVAPIEADAHSRGLRNIPFVVPSKGAVRPGPPRREMPLS
jgi:hypothetical protein